MAARGRVAPSAWVSKEGRGIMGSLEGCVPSKEVFLGRWKVVEASLIAYSAKLP